MIRVLLVFTLFLAYSTISKAAESCDHYEQYPLAGHPVAVLDLHASDKNFQAKKELMQLKLILLEPGICVAEISEKGWYQGRVFVFKSRSTSFSHGNIIEIEAGKFK